MPAGPVRKNKSSRRIFPPGCCGKISGRVLAPCYERGHQKVRKCGYGHLLYLLYPSNLSTFLKVIHSVVDNWQKVKPGHTKFLSRMIAGQTYALIRQVSATFT